MRIDNTIYFDHQATTPLDSRVLAEMAPLFAEAFGNPHSADHALGWKAAEKVEEAATRIGMAIGADADEVIFVSGATEANNLALLGLGRRAAGGMRNRILVAATEHKCVLESARVLQAQNGYRLEYIPVDVDGKIQVGKLKDALDEDVLLVSIMAVNNEIGTIQDLSLISSACRERGVLFHCDAAQAPCAIDARLIADCADLASFSAHKAYGPKGIGALFISREVQDRIEPLIYGGGQQRGLRSGTIPSALCVGMAAAFSLVQSEKAGVERGRLAALRDLFVAELQKLSWRIQLNGSPSERHPGNANLWFHGFNSHDLLLSLQPHLAASTGSACTSGFQEPSYVLREIGLSREAAQSSIRFSLGRDTSEQEVMEAVELIDKALRELADDGLCEAV